MSSPADFRKQASGRIHRARLSLALRIQRRMLEKGQETRRSQLRLLAPPSGAVVFLGDSITEGGEWHEWFPERKTVNRGIGGETSGQLMTRVHHAINDPRAVFLLIGTNDLALGFTPTEIAENVRSILRVIDQLAPNTPTFVQSVMPRGAKWRGRVKELNRRLRQECGESAIEYVDLWPALEGSDGALRDDFTLDGIHLTGAGYHAWTKAITPYVSRDASPGTASGSAATS